MKLALPKRPAAVQGGAAGPEGEGGAAAAVKKKRRLKHPVLAVIALLLVALLVWRLLFSGGGASGLSATDLYTLSRADISDSISATGTVESLDSQKVYSSLSYPVKELYVEVGDTVKAGDLLCELDSTQLEKDIQSKELALQSANLQIAEAENGYDASQISNDASVRNAYEAWQKAQKDYEDYKKALEGNLDPSTLSADASVDNARAALQNAQADYAAALKTYKNARDQWRSASGWLLPTGVSADEYAQAAEERAARQDEYDQSLSAHEQARQEYESLLASATAEDQALAIAKDSLTAASTALSMATDAIVLVNDTVSREASSLISLLGTGLTSIVNNFNTKLNNYETARTALDTAVRSLTSAELSYDQTLLSRDSTYNSANNQLAAYETAVASAKAAYDTAVAAAASSLKTSANNVESTKLSAQTTAQLQLEQLREDLNDTKIYAPSDGTVTACYAVKDSPISTTAGGLGLLFVIEDVDSLIIETDVDEYDVADLYVGMPTTIRSEAAGNETYAGEVSFIAPTTTKTTNGTSTEPGKGKFAIRVSVTTPKTNLRIGTAARVSFVRQQADSALSVPYESVYTNASGQSCVLLAESTGGNAVRLTECPVTLGLENDAFIVVESDQLDDGSTIVSSPYSYMDKIGQEVPLSAGVSVGGPAMGGSAGGVQVTVGAIAAGGVA